MSCEAKQKPAGIAPSNAGSVELVRARFVIRKKMPTEGISVFQSCLWPDDDYIRNVFAEELMMYEVRMD
jgi:hypothetical protein